MLDDGHLDREAHEVDALLDAEPLHIGRAVLDGDGEGGGDGSGEGGGGEGDGVVCVVDAVFGRQVEYSPSCL